MTAGGMVSKIDTFIPAIFYTRQYTNGALFYPRHREHGCRIEGVNAETRFALRHLKIPALFKASVLFDLILFIGDYD